MNIELDGDEYLQLALHASGKGDHHAALVYLKSALAQDNRNALALYMLAAQHAELGLYLRARSEFLQVLEINPDMEIARFQLGLLHTQLDEAEAARATFGHLAEFTADAALKAFARGLIALLDDKPAEAHDLIQSGLTNCSNEPLKNDMARVLANIDARLGSTGAAAATAAPAQAAAEPAKPRAGIFLGAYKNAADRKQ